MDNPKEPLNKSSAAAQWIFYPSRAVCAKISHCQLLLIESELS